MRTCEYCGNENADEAARCSECGTEFLVPTARLVDFEPRPLNLKRHILACFGPSPVRRAQTWGVAFAAGVTVLPWLIFLLSGGSLSLLGFLVLCNLPSVIACNLLRVAWGTGPVFLFYGLVANLICGFTAGTLVGLLLKAWRCSACSAPTDTTR